MVINVRIDMLEEKNLSPNEYTILKCCDEGVPYPSAIIDMVDTCTSLQSKGFVKIVGSEDDGTPIISFREKGLLLFNSEDVEKKFAEFWTTYPMKVLSSTGYRILRSKDLSTKQAGEIRKKYVSLIKKNPELHTHIVRCLNKQLEVERRNLAYMQNIETWMNQRTWEKYEGLLEPEGTVKEEGYGSKLI